MTICIAAACENGRNIVAVTDGRLSLGDVTGDALPGKMLWYGDWQFLYAGIPASFSSIIEHVEDMGMEDPNSLSRRNIQQTVRKAYRKFSSRFSSCDSLDPFDMTMEEFKKTGRRSFGEEFHGELLRRISQKAAQINEQLIVTGWAYSPNAVMIYELGPQGDWLHTAAGFACIGSGAPIAQSMLLTLGQVRHRTLAETIFNVACAKFASEKSTDLDVGPSTTIFVSHKRSADDEQSKPPGTFVDSEDVALLRKLWEEHLKPRIPDEARLTISEIGARVNHGKSSIQDLAETMNASNRLRMKNQAPSPASSPNPQSPTGDP